MITGQDNAASIALLVVVCECDRQEGMLESLKVILHRPLTARHSDFPCLVTTQLVRFCV